MTALPPGTHPRDKGLAPEQEFDHRAFASPPQHTRTGRAPWSRTNVQATPTFQRLAAAFSLNLIAVDTNQGGTAKVVGRQPGRTRLTLWVPEEVPISGTMTATPAGVLVAASEGEIQQNIGVPLNVGDSIDISSEQGVWVGLQPGNTVGYVCALHCFDPAGGPQVGTG